MANLTKRKKFIKRDEKRGSKFTSDQERETSHKYNDVSWYVKNDAMLRDAASLSFNTPLGAKFDPNKLWSMKSGLDMTYVGKSVPGLFTFEFLPCIGQSSSSTSPANLAAQNIYSYVRYMNSGAKNYDQADLMLYLLSMDSIYMFWNWAKRIYGYAMSYSQKNKYMPVAYGTAEHVDLQDVINNLADYRLWLNSLAARISAFCVPAVMPFFIRHSWMVSNIYTDGVTAKAQQYMFVPGGFYLYDETGSTYGGRLRLLTGPAAGKDLKFSDLVKLGNRLLDAVSYSEDIGVMSGDILKAYGQEKLFKLAPVEPDYQVLPVYNEEVLMQMENAACVVTNRTMSDDAISGSKFWDGMEISQNPDTGYLVWNPALLESSLKKEGTLLNMHKDEVAPSDVMVATRLTACQQGATFTAVGTEFVYSFKTWKFNATGDSVVSREMEQVMYIGDVGTELGGESTVMTLPHLMEISQFNRHPIVPVTAKYNGKFYYLGSIGDIANYTVVDDETLEQIHTTAIMSEFNIPQIGSF